MGSNSSSAGKVSRILVVDDHPMMRDCLAVAISTEPDLMVCGEADTFGRAMELIKALQPDLVLADLSLKDSYGLDLVQAIRNHYPKLNVLVVSMHDETLHAERVIHSGARGYIEKHQTSREVIKAIRTVLDGGVYLSERMVGRLLKTFSGARRGETSLPIDTLTDREMRVFQLLGEGVGTRKIAKQLGVDMRTVETYRARIKSKLGLKSSFDLLQQAIRWAESGSSRSGREGSV